MRPNPLRVGLAAVFCTAMLATTVLAAPQLKPNAVGYAPPPSQQLRVGGPQVLAGNVLYDNTGNPSNTYYDDQFGEEAIDDLHLVTGGSLDTLSFEYYEPSAGGPFSATVRFYNNPGGLDLGITPLAGPYTVTGLASGRHIVAVGLPDAPVVGTDLWVGVQFSSTTAGLIINEVPSIGVSHDLYFENGSLLWFDGNPKANFALRLVDSPSYELTVSTVGMGTVASSLDQPIYIEGTAVQLTATPETGWHFVGWSGAATGSDNPLTVSMDADKSIIANFEINTYALNVTTAGQGAVAKSPDQAAYDHGTIVQLMANPQVGWHFVEWSGAASGSDNPIDVTMDAAQSVTATFEINTYVLSIATVGEGTVAKSPEQALYDHGSVVQLMATAEVGWHFVEWSGAASGTANPIDVTMDAAQSVTATFAINTYALSLTTAGQGTVTKSPAQALYDHGSVVQLMATPEVGWHFVEWSGAASGTDNPIDVTMDGAKSVTATFAINTYALNVSIDGLGMVAKSPNQAAYDHGSLVQLAAKPEVGWEFAGWTGSVTGTDNPIDVKMDDVKSVTATFAINTYALNVTTVGQGTVAKSPDEAVYDHGTSVYLVAVPEFGWHFVAWSGAASGSANPINVSMISAKSITATFAINTYALGVTTVGQGTVSKIPEQALYDHGAVVQLMATPEVGWHFVGWSGSTTSSANPLDVTMLADKSVTATFEINTYALSVATAGQGTVTKKPDQALYDHGTIVQLMATPEVGWHFVEWSGATTGSANPRSVSMDAAKSVTATFAINTYALSVAMVGQGAVARSPEQASYDHGSVVQLMANPQVGWHFVGWSGAASGSANPIDVTMDAAKSVTATFVINTYALSVTTAGLGTVAKSPNQALYDHGTVVQLTANPQVGWHFVGWSGGATGSANPIDVTMDGAKTVTATFAINSYALNVATVGQGTVAKSPNQAAYDYGSVVQLTANPQVGWHFVSWSGGATGSSNPIDVTMDAAKSVTATFAINTYALSVATTGLGTVAKSPDQALYDHGTVVQLTATPEVGWHLVSWSGSATGSANPLAVTMDAAKSVTANFAINSYALNVTASGQGTVTKSPNQAAYDFGTIVQLTATPAPGWEFKAWSGDASGTEPTLDVLVDQEKNITATFLLVVALDFKPHKIDIKLKDKLVTTYIDLPEPFDAADIDIGSIRLNDVVGVSDRYEPKIEKHGSRLKVKFSRLALIPTLPPGEQVPITVTGLIATQCFKGVDVIKVKSRKIKKPAPNDMVAPGTRVLVEWDPPSDPEEPTKITLMASFDNGLTWRIEKENLSNTGNFEWTVPHIPTHGARLNLLTIFDTDESGVISDWEIAQSDSFTIVGTISADASRPLLALRPVNPVVGPLSVRFSLADDAPATLSVFDVSGRQVASRQVGSSGAGWHTVQFRRLPPGVFMVRLHQAGRTLTKRVAVIR